MDAATSLVVLSMSSNAAVAMARSRLSHVGLRLLQTFDLQDARSPLNDCACPHHGTRQCDCQMAVLLVYGSSGPPATLLLHSNDGKTWLSLVDTPAQPADCTLIASIKRALEINSPSEGL